MRQSPRGPFVKTAAVTLAILASSVASAAAARSHSGAAALSPPACGFAGGALADPAETQRCLADRYKAPKPKPNTAPPSAPAANATAPAKGA